MGDWVSSAGGSINLYYFFTFFLPFSFLFFGIMQKTKKGDCGMEYVLKTNGLTKCYGDFPALNGLDMHVPKGAIYGFIGRNGAGKTTLIRLVCGLQKPTGGRYVLYGKAYDLSLIHI